MKLRPSWRRATAPRVLSVAIALAMAMTLSAAPMHAQGRPVLVFAAASLKNAFDVIDASYQRKTGKHITVSLAASSTLAKQIANGAPADIFISADLAWMDYLAKRNLIKPGSRRNLLGNELVLVAPMDSALQVKIGPGFPLAKLLGGGKLAMANTAAVPAGKYGKAALTTLGVWASVQGRIAQAENVRAALELVALGEAPLGIVYRTDAAVEPKVKVVGVFPDDTHPPIIYPIAQTAASTDPDAANVLAYLESPAVATLFEQQGFKVLARTKP